MYTRTAQPAKRRCASVYAVNMSTPPPSKGNACLPCIALSSFVVRVVPVVLRHIDKECAMFRFFILNINTGPVCAQSFYIVLRFSGSIKPYSKNA